MEELVKELTALLAKYRLTFGNELALQDQLAEIFAVAGIPVAREFKLSASDRLDFLTKLKGCCYAIEVKVGGSLNGHLRQMQRYNRHQDIAGTILICTKPFQIPETLAGKPCARINVGKNRL